MKQTFFLFIMLTLLGACFLQKDKSCFLRKDKFTKSLTKYHIPPNCIQIDSNLYYDKTEATNFFWLEYEYWNQRIFGKQSQRFLFARLDTNVWLALDSCNSIKNRTSLYEMTYYYLRHPVYCDYPVIGVFQQQAIDYCKWRSDRVFEFILINEGVLEYNPKQDSTNYFTIERYFKGEYNGCVPDKRFRYPAYRLPTDEEWRKAKAYFGSLQIGKLKKKEINILSDTLEINAGINPCPNDTTFNMPLESVYFSHYYKKKGYNIQGNVREWSATPNITLGGGWIDKLSTIKQQDTFLTTQPNVYTGFRAVCEWKEWEGMK